MTYILGIDPGPDPGHFAIEVAAGRIIDAWPGFLVDGLDHGDGGDVLAVEAFHISQRTARAGHVQASKDTVAQVEQLKAEASARGLRWFSRPAGQVKPWATDARLKAWGLWEPTAGHRHTRDAARHALYAAVNLGLLPPRPRC